MVVMVSDARGGGRRKRGCNLGSTHRPETIRRSVGCCVGVIELTLGLSGFWPTVMVMRMAGWL